MLKINGTTRFSCCRRRVVDVESIYPAGSYIVEFYDVCDMGHGACSVTPRSSVHAILVVVVVVHRSLTRMYDQREICRALCHLTRGSLYRIRALARIG